LVGGSGKTRDPCIFLPAVVISYLETFKNDHNAHGPWFKS